MKRLDLTNEKFYKLTVLEITKDRKGEKVMWKCQCDCGNITYVSTPNLRLGRIKSCGCLKVQKLINRSTTHNQRHTKLYEVWKTMKQRCYNSNNVSYHNYGGRGIKVCDEWLNSFQNFYDWSISNGYKEDDAPSHWNKLTIDRINVNGNYEPSNCRWADRETQANNTRFTKYYTYNGKTQTIRQWSNEYLINYETLRNRICVYNWSVERALTTPVKKKSKT